MVKVDVISRLSYVYQSINSGMSLVHVYGNHNIGKPASTLPLASINVRLDALAEHMMTSFLLFTATRNTISIGISDPYRLPIISIHGAPIHSNLVQWIAYEISKRRLLQHWDDRC